MRITDEMLISAYNNSPTAADFFAAVGIRKGGSNSIRHIAERLNRLGLPYPNPKWVKSPRKKRSVELTYATVFCENSKARYLQIPKWREEVFKVHGKKCSNPDCKHDGYHSAFGHPVKFILTIDHINGINTDNRMENLRPLCPNCGASLPTHCVGNKAAKQIAGQSFTMEKNRSIVSVMENFTGTHGQETISGNAEEAVRGRSIQMGPT